uniref:Sema domain-containing protein n=1 Tax=Cyprinus carpio TaxID=7962 RepID=A0A8C1Z2C1_CYPCA
HISDFCTFIIFPAVNLFGSVLSAKRFSPNGVFNYTSLLLSKEDNMLYVGARETLFALNITDISRTQLHTPQRKREECSFKGKDLQIDCFNYIKILLRVNSTHLYVCGTYAFSPICAYINTSDFSLVRNEMGEIITEDGRSRCPFNPEYKSTAIMADGELYAGTVSNFQGNEPIIYKSLGQGTALKTENSLNWLQDPAFVGSAYIQESLPKGNAVGDDDKIYFFFSEAGKEFDFFDNTIVSRIARVCKVRDSFLTLVFVLKVTLILAATLQKSLIAVRKRAIEILCSVSEASFSIFLQCITNTARAQGISSSLHMPDKVLNFVKDHFLMDSVIRSQPLLLKRNVRYTQLAVHRVQALHKTYDVLFIGTDDGRIHKAINVKNKMYIIEELVIFPEPQSVQHIELDDEKGLLFVSSYSGLVEIPLANCSNYQSCGECVLSRDPYCAWTGKQCSNIKYALTKSQWQQDVDDANTAVCKMTMASPRLAKPTPPRDPSCHVIQIPANTFTVLPCKLRSNLAESRWEYSHTAERFVYPSPDGGLVVVAQVEREEIYQCWSEEGGYRQLLANYCVKADHESTTLTGRSRTQLVPQGEAIILPGETWSPEKTKTYWNELIVVCALLVFSLVVLSLFVAYRNRDRMKSMLKEGECPNMQQKKPRIPGKHTESLPLNGNNIPPSVSDHKGYQTLNDNYICSTPTHECSSPENSKSFSESEKRPLNLKESHVEISPTCPRPRVRLGSEIKDSIV